MGLVNSAEGGVEGGEGNSDTDLGARWERRQSLSQLLPREAILYPDPDLKSRATRKEYALE